MRFCNEQLHRAEWPVQSIQYSNNSTVLFKVVVHTSRALPYKTTVSSGVFIPPSRSLDPWNLENTASVSAAQPASCCEAEASGISLQASANFVLQDGVLDAALIASNTRNVDAGSVGLFPNRTTTTVLFHRYPGCFWRIESTLVRIIERCVVVLLSSLRRYNNRCSLVPACCPQYS